MPKPDQSTNPEKSLVYDVPEAGALLGLTRNASYEAAKRGDFPTIRIGKLIRVPKAAFHRMLKMTAVVVPFPIVRRHGFIHKQAAYAACMNPESAVRYIEHQLLIQRDATRRRGIAENLIAQELRCMAGAMRMEFLQVTSAMGDR